VLCERGSAEGRAGSHPLSAAASPTGGRGWRGCLALLLRATRPGPGHVVAIGVAVANPEWPPPAPSALGDDRPQPALRTDPELLGGRSLALDVLALRVAVAAHERPE